ncbi:hypothetical protein [Acanthopleuribacter pedis]|uniref:Uncharacterized protein n=1 Tax=Acanthopleuribacter pedis TaxID=442870 RepID=A0A8J7U2U9_9BACT|nr:hypothetical protein [Acanthopleuribacter pedis]MBO1317653.1 hypothetical protein [Acanthopleuribacter pedis]
MVQKRTLDQIDIYDHDLYKNLNLPLIDLAIDIVARNNTRFTVFPNSKGIARIINLLEWQAHAYHEYLDGDGIFVDQIVHIALHQAVDTLTGGRHPEGALLAEAFASASDLYLLGNIAKTGEETDFVVDTMESLGSYYEMYADGETGLNALLEQLLADPFQTMINVADYLMQFCQPLLYSGSVPEITDEIQRLEQNGFYPLVHHYNTTNWILTIRSQYPQWYPDPVGVGTIKKRLSQSETHFLGCIREVVLGLHEA